MEEIRHNPIGARITRRLIVLGILWFVYSTIFTGLCVTLTRSQIYAVSAVVPLVLLATVVILCIIHRIRFLKVDRALSEIEEGKPVPREEIEGLTRFVLAYPGRLALTIGVVGIVLFTTGTLAASFVTRFRHAQVLSILAGGMSLGAIFALVAYLDVKAMIGPALSILVSRAGGFSGGRRFSLMNKLWVFSVAIAVVPFFFLGFLFYNRAIDAIEEQMETDGLSGIEALADWLSTPEADEAAFTKEFNRKAHLFAGEQGTILWVDLEAPEPGRKSLGEEPRSAGNERPVGTVSLDSSMPGGISPRAQESPSAPGAVSGSTSETASPAGGIEGQTGRKEAAGGASLGMYDLQEDIIDGILTAKDPGFARDILSGQIVVYTPVTKTVAGTTQKAELVYIFRRARAKLNLALTYVLVFGVAIIFLLFWMIHIHGMSIRVPLQEIQIVSERIADGDLTQDVPILSDDEVGSLGLSFRVMVSFLRTLIRRAQDSARSMATVATRLSDGSKEIALGSHHQVESVDDTAASIEEINFSIRGIADNVEELAASALESSSSITEMGQSIREVDGHTDSLSRSLDSTFGSIQQMAASIAQIAGNVDRLKHEGESTAAAMHEIDASSKGIREQSETTETYSERVIADASRGEEAVSRTVESIHHMREVSSRAMEAMRTLSAAIDEIGEILRIQKGITDGMNMLALNAAIIAAHTGEHGRQFGVIASNIKNLASKSRERTKDIEELIGKVQTSGEKALDAVEAGYHSIERGLELAAAAGESLGQILQSARQSTAMVKRIASTTVEQAKGSRFALDAVERIVEGLGEIAAATREQEEGSQSITRATDEIKNTSRLVKRSTQEQTIGSSQIVRNIENIREMVNSINRATGELRRGSERVVSATELIRDASRHNEAMVHTMTEEVQALFSQSEDMSNAVANFNLDGYKRPGNEGDGIVSSEAEAADTQAGGLPGGVEGTAAGNA